MLTAGVAKREITDRSPEARVHDPLYVKALVLDDGTTRLAILAMDTIAIGDYDVAADFLPRLRARAETEAGIPGANILVNASHTHTPGRMLAPAAEVLDAAAAAVREAAANREPVVAGAGTGVHDRLSINRTLRLKDGRHWTVRQANPCPPDEAFESMGPVDPEVGVLRFDRPDGRPLAVVYNFACHPLLGIPGLPITANYPGFASGVIERELGHGAMALFLQGAGGDAVEAAFKDVHEPRHAEVPGTMLGLAVLGIRRTIATAPATLAVARKEIRLPVRHDIPERIAELRATQAALLESLQTTSLNFKQFLPLYLQHSLHPDFPGDYAYRYRRENDIGLDCRRRRDEKNQGDIDKYRRNILAMEELTRIQERLATFAFHQAIVERTEPAGLPSEIQAIRVGDAAIVTSTTEMLTEVGLKIKHASPFKPTFISAYTNGYTHYGPPASDYPKGGYEVTECNLAPEWEGLALRESANLLLSIHSK